MNQNPAVPVGTAGFINQPVSCLTRGGRKEKKRFMNNAQGKMTPYEREHLASLRQHLAECTVLLKKNGAFPLEKAGPVALYGSGARHTIRGGTGSGEVNSRFFITVEQGLEEAGFTVTTKAWLDGYDRIADEAHRQFIRKLKAGAGLNPVRAVMACMGAVMPEPDYDLPLDGEGETAVYVLARVSGEGSDRSAAPGDLLLTQTEIRDILFLQELYPRFMLVLNTGGPVDLAPVTAAGNILVLSQLGTETGAVLADILLGKAAPSGRLTATWSAGAGCARLGDFGEKDDTRYREGIYVGYRWFDAIGEKPLFPFGFGLGYTEFSLSGTEIRKEGEQVCVTAEVTNTGAQAGKETLQLYVSPPAGKLDQPPQCLAGYAKTGELAPGQKERVTVSFRIRDLASFSPEDSAYILEAGKYVLRLGRSSADNAPVGILFLPSAITVRKVRRTMGMTDFIDWKPEAEKPGTVPGDLPVIRAEPGEIPCETVRYDGDFPPEKEAGALGDRELIHLTVGSYGPGLGFTSVIGSAGKAVAGAAGETTGTLKKKGIGVMVMADGPAGLRLCPAYFRDRRGAHSLTPVLLNSMMEVLPAPVAWLLRLLNAKPHRTDRVQYQYATAIPVGTAVAQSWNTAFAELCGDIVGDEMERFGVHLWLAPALNIHRCVLCGRNFEYYSEDPLLSGRTAAAVTRGVQKHPGRGVTLKHFAANNQEYRRFNSNSVVSERALRDIYLRGFEICVREAQPLAVMTSYNLINGTHASERKDLVEDVLRREFGFDGLVMTDWTIAGTGEKGAAWPEARADRISRAGVDLVMPGSRGDVRRIRKALKRGEITRGQLEENASRVLRMIRMVTGRC